MTANVALAPAGDVDRRFIAMMVPRDQRAIDLAKAELKYGSDEQLRELAREIVARRAPLSTRSAPIDRSTGTDHTTATMSR
jgi:uncharacterized protein (DUF305 family)